MAGEWPPGPPADPPSRPCTPQIDISGYVVRSRDELTLKNAGATPAASFLLCDPQMDQAAFLEVWRARSWGSGAAGASPPALPPPALERRSRACIRPVVRLLLLPLSTGAAGG